MSASILFGRAGSPTLTLSGTSPLRGFISASDRFCRPSYLAPAADRVLVDATSVEVLRQTTRLHSHPPIFEAGQRR
jgi:hypothetical protein